MSHALAPVGAFLPGPKPPVFEAEAIARAIEDVRATVHIVRDGADGRIGLSFGGHVAPVEKKSNGAPTLPLLGTLPALYPEWLGDRSFNELHRVRFPYVVGEMANGISTTRMVIAAAEAGLLGFFGAAGLSPDVVEEAIVTMSAALDERGLSWGVNLIHSPNEPALEEALVSLFLRRAVHRVSASAYLALTPAVVRYAASGLATDADGRIHRKNHLFAKVSRAEVARVFLSPAPAAMLDALVAGGALTLAEANLARHVPIAEDVTVEADSGGHTDNRPLTAIFPIVAKLRDSLSQRYEYACPIRIGAAGGLGTPVAVAAAFALGAAYVLTGSVNQSAVEAGLCERGRKLLAAADMADVIMAPAADMFEAGVKVQVLRRGTMFGVRALRLHELYTAYDSLESIPREVLSKLERELLGTSCEAIWATTRAFFETRDPREVDRAERDPKHKMALVFRWYLGLSSRWAIAGDEQRAMDFQIWCGPAMGAFNDWVRGSFLEPIENRTVAQIAHNLLEGAAVLTRAQQLRTYGVNVLPGAFAYAPRPLA